MGQSLARNMANKGIKVIGWDRHEEKAKEFLEKYGNENLTTCGSFECISEDLQTIPRKYLMLVPAGDPVDEVIQNLRPFLEKGDIVIDAGNSNYRDTIRRTKELEKEGINFVGMGISGGEEGALRGPSLMPGGSEASWEALSPLLEKIAAKDFKGNPCVTHIGKDGAGHYIKMVHNGIEYGVMQMMAESYLMLRTMYGLSVLEVAKIFKKFTEGKLRSYLFDISVPILEQKDNLTEGYLVDFIMDKAAQKGTGSWVAIDALERGMSLPTVTMAVFARNASSQKIRRMELAKTFHKTTVKNPLPLDLFLLALEKALYAGMISAYAQGFDLMAKAAEDEGWNLNFAEITRIWEGGCIIRADLLNFLNQAFESAGGKAVHLFSIPEVKDALQENFEAWRQVVSLGISQGLPMPALTTSLSYFEEMTSEVLSANFIQALRDYFGAHTYERTDREGSFHTAWSDLNL